MRIPERLLTVSVLGSCRVHHPIAWLRDRVQIYMNGGIFNSYSHQVDDVLQMCLIREGRLTICDPLSELVFGSPVPILRQARSLNPVAPSCSDIAIVELSSIKRYESNGFFFQSNHIERVLIPKFPRPNDAEVWLEEIARPERNQPLIDEMVGANLSPELLSIARNMKITVQDYDAVISGMKAIAKIVRVPILWVSHNRVPTSDGSQIPQRESLFHAMRQGALELNHILFDPTPYILNFGQTKAMEPDSSNEYTEDFIAALGVIFHHCLYEAFDHSRTHMA